MRVGFLTYALERPLAGIGRYAVELARALAAREDGLEIVLLTAGGPGPLAGLGLRQVSLPGCRLLPGLITLGNLLIPILARRLRLDIVHDTTGVTPLALGAGGARTVVTVHDVIPWSFPGVSTTLDTVIYRRWLPWVLPRVDGILTVSECSRADLTRYLHIPPDRIHNTSEGVADAYRPATESAIAQVRARYGLSAPYILYVGSVEERKNLRGVLQAYARLRQRGLACSLAIVGAAKWKYDGIMRTLADLQLADEVVFTGYVPDDDLPVLYSGAAVFAFPSLYEGFGLPALEAMACGTPVVAANTSSLPEVVGDAALTVDPADVEALAEAMGRVLADEALRQELRDKGLGRARQFTWQRAAERTVAVYRALLNR